MGDRPSVQVFWYVKARNLETGAEIQRLSANGAVTEREVALEMRYYLVQTGRASAINDGWQIVEVVRWP
jgi:hypothetical protein